jgi:hypothetical protein
VAGPAATATITLGPGEGLDLLLEWGGRPIGYDLWEALRRQLDWLEKHWQLPDDGIWESGGRRRRRLEQLTPRDSSSRKEARQQLKHPTRPKARPG